MLTVKRQVFRLIIIGNAREILPHYILTFQFTFVLLGGDYMIWVGLDETLSHFAGIPAVLQTLHKLYPAIKCEKVYLGKVGYLICTAWILLFWDKIFPCNRFSPPKCDEKVI